MMRRGGGPAWGLIHHLREFKPVVERPPTKPMRVCRRRLLPSLRDRCGPHQRALQRLIELQRDDVVDPLALQMRQKRILTEPGVRA